MVAFIDGFLCYLGIYLKVPFAGIRVYVDKLKEGKNLFFLEIVLIGLFIETKYLTCCTAVCIVSLMNMLN